MYNLDESIARDLEKIGKKKGFENLYLYLSNDCDFCCKHCYLGERLVKRENFELAEIKRQLSFWKKLGSEKLCFIGGEPTLYPHLKECVEFAKELHYKKIIIGSNGSDRACEKLFEFLPKDLSYIQISLDGTTENTNDYIRKNGAYKQTTNTIKKLVDRGFDTRIIMTVNSYNSKEMMDMLYLAEKLGVSLVKFHIMSEIGNAQNTDIKSLSPEEWIAKCKEIYEFAINNRDRRYKISFQPAYEYKNEKCKYADLSQYKGCVGKNMERISVFPDGKCYICSFLFDYRIYYAKVDGNYIRKCNDSEYELFNRNSCHGCKVPCDFDGCAAEDIVINKRACLNAQDIFPVCRLWKIEL